MNNDITQTTDNLMPCYSSCFLTKGYSTIASIPAGAMDIAITEMGENKNSLGNVVLVSFGLLLEFM